MQQALPMHPAGPPPEVLGSLGEADLWEATSKAIAPVEDMSSLEFGSVHRVYSKEGRASRWRPSDTPWAGDILDTLDDSSPYRRIVCPKGTQLGFTELGLIWMGRGLLFASSCLTIFPTEAVAKRVVKTKFRPMLKSTPILEGIFGGRALDTSLHFSSDAVDLIFAGSNSPANFASITVPKAMGDEVDRWSPELLNEGDPVDLLENRIAEYGFLGKLFLPSSPTVEGVSIVWREWLDSDQRYFFCPCPKCGHKQAWVWEQMKWDPGQPDTAQMACTSCEERSNEAAWKTAWVDGEWRATVADPVRKDTAGFHLSTLYARIGQRSWAQLVQQYEAVMASGLSSRIQTFRNTILGLPWKVTEEALAVDTLRERLDHTLVRGHVPAWALLLSAGVDYQDNRAEIFVWAWGPDRERVLVDKVEVSRVDAKGRLLPARVVAERMEKEALERHWEHELGGTLQIEMALHDAGNKPADVYDVLEHLDQAKNYASKGVEGWGKNPRFSVPKIIDVRRDGKVVKHGRKQLLVYTAEGKRDWYDDLRRARADDGPSERFVHLPGWIDEEEGLLEQFVAEELRKSTRGKLKWEKVRPRNEGLDCAILGEGARHLLKSHRWSASDWESRRRALNPEAAAPDEEREDDSPPDEGGGGWINNNSGKWV